MMAERPERTAIKVELKEYKYTAGSILDHVLGVVYGNCCGDAIGLLTEFMNLGMAEAHYGEKEHLEFSDKYPDAHRIRWKNGDWTDDSDQMLLIADTIINKQKADPLDFGERLLNWARYGYAELGDVAGMGIGSTTKHVLDRFRGEKEETAKNPHSAAQYVWEKSGREVAANGAVMRTSILGVYQYKNLQAVRDNTLALCKVSHYDPRCQASCVAVTTAIALMLQRQPEFLTSTGLYNIPKIIDYCYQQTKKIISKRKHRKEFKKYIYCEDIKKLNLSDYHSIGYTLKCVGAGFWALKQNDFRTALEAITMQAGDADTNGAVAGALLGCKLGATAIPDSWTNNLLYKAWLNEKLSKFLDVAEIEYELKPPLQVTSEDKEIC